MKIPLFATGILICTRHGGRKSILRIFYKALAYVIDRMLLSKKEVFFQISNIFGASSVSWVWQNLLVDAVGNSALRLRREVKSETQREEQIRKEKK